MLSMKIRRIELDLTQEVVAKKLKIRVQQYGKYERREQIPNVVMASKIAKVLKVTTDEIAKLYI